MVFATICATGTIRKQSFLLPNATSRGQHPLIVQYQSMTPRGVLAEKQSLVGFPS